MSTKTETEEVRYKTPVKTKTFIGILILVIASLVLWMKISSPANSVVMGNYSYTETGDLVDAQGSWLTPDTNLANPLQTVEIQCWQRFGYCFVNYAELNEGNYLSVNSEIYEIDRWADDIIQSKPNKLGCVEYQLTLNRRAETVTNIRHTIDNTTEFCKEMSKDPITLTLGDGYKRIMQNSSKR
jgi:hypothetical protein